MPNKLTKLVRKPKSAKPVKVEIVPSKASRIEAPYDGMKYRARDALSTLSRAEEIKRDKPLMKAVKTEARNQVKSLSRVCNK